MRAALMSTMMITLMALPSFAGTFADVHNGMEKDNVLARVGGPKFSERVHGQDWWTYEQRNRFNDDVVVTEVHFEDGKVVYVGPHQKPAITAAEKDRLNEQSNAEEDAKADAEANERDRRLGIKRGYLAPEDAADRRLRESMYGLEPDPQSAKRTFAPTFEQVK